MTYPSLYLEDESGERWESFYTPANTMDADEARVRGGPSRSHYFRKRKVLSADTLSAAIRGSDTYARTKVALGNLSLALVSFLPQSRRVEILFGSMVPLDCCEVQNGGCNPRRKDNGTS
jgi:hypothetical protein